MSHTKEPWERRMRGCVADASVAKIIREDFAKCFEELDLLRKQRDTLLSALELAAETISELETAGDLDTETMPVIMSAIASVKGGAA